MPDPDLPTAPTPDPVDDATTSGEPLSLPITLHSPLSTRTAPVSTAVGHQGSPAEGWLLTHWPGPVGAAPRAVLVVAVVAGAVAAITVQPDRPAIGWLIAGTVAAVAVRMAVPRTDAVHDRAARIRWSVATLALLAVGALRAADWLFALCVLTAIPTASLAVAGGRSIRGLLLGVVAVPLAALRGLPWLRAGARALRRTGSGGRTLVALGYGALLLVVFGALLAGADSAFAGVLDAIVPRVDGDSVARWIVVFVLAALAVAGACYTATARPDVPDSAAARPLRTVEWGLPVGMLVALFGGFVVVQITVLFGGRGHVLRTGGLTAAQYARSGFWQLAAVTALTLLVLGVAARRSATATVLDRIRRRALLGPLAVLTLVIVASALSRMWAYQQAYGFTVLRLLVQACELWLGVVYLLVIAAGLRRTRAHWLPRAVVGSAVAGLLVIAAVDPERFVAERDVARWASTGQVDLAYLGSLSMDATPALLHLPRPSLSCGVAVRAVRADRPDGVFGWNLARDRARAEFGDVCGVSP